MKKINIIFFALVILTGVLSFNLKAQVAWTRNPSNPVIGNAVDPSVIYDASDSLYKMWYNALGDAYNIFYATSPDGTHWTPYGDGPVLSGGGSDSFDVYARGATVLHVGDSYTMYYTAFDGETWTIGMATSADGINWTKHAGPVISPVGGTWSAGQVLWPSAFFDGHTYYLYYRGGLPPVIGLATSTDGVNWTNYAGNPILSGTDSTWDVWGVDGPNIVFANNHFYMLYGGRPSFPGTLSYGYAVSSDGIHWTKSVYNPVFRTSVVNTWEGTTLGTSCLLEKDGVFSMWYDAQSSDDGSWSIGLATSPLTDTTTGNGTGGGGTIGPNINLSVGAMHAFPGDTIVVPVNAGFPVNKSYISSSVKISGFENKGVSFLSVDTAGTIAGSLGWNFEVNNAASLRLAFAGAHAASGSGVLFKLRFLVTVDTASTILLNIDTAFFDTGADSVVVTGGHINVLLPFLGDVDLNGTVQPFDAAAVLEYLVGLDSLDQDQLFNANVSGDSTVSAADARSILRYTVGLISSFPDTSVHSVAGTGTVELIPVYAGHGDVVSYPVLLNDPANVISAEGTIHYDPSFLQYVGTGSSEVLDSFVANNASGVLRFAGCKNVPVTSSGVLMELKFKVVGPSGSSQISLTKLRLNEGRVIDNAGHSFVVLGVNGQTSTIPKDFTLSNYPNPFNPVTTVSYGLPTASHVEIVVLNMLGQTVASLVNENQIAGTHQITWKPAGASGMYFIRMEAQSISGSAKNVLRTEKVVYLK